MEDDRLRNKNFWDALKKALSGIWYGVKTQRNIKIQIVVSIIVIILLIIICYGILGRYYQKHGMVSTTKKKVVTKEKNVIKKADAPKKRGKKNV